MEDAVTVEDSELKQPNTVVLVSAIWMENWTCSSVWESWYDAGGTEFTIHWLNPQSLHCSCKDTIGTYLPWHISCIILCSPKRETLLRNYNLNNILQAYQYHCGMQRHYTMINDYTWHNICSACFLDIRISTC